MFNCFLLITLRRVWPPQWPLNCGVTRHVPTIGDIHVSTRVYRCKHVVMRRDTELQPDVLRRGDLHVSIDIHTYTHGYKHTHVVMRRVTELQPDVLTRGRRYTRVHTYAHAVNALFSNSLFMTS